MPKRTSKIRIQEAPSQDLFLTIELQDGSKLEFTDFNEPELYHILYTGLVHWQSRKIQWGEDMTIYHIDRTEQDLIVYLANSGL